MTPEQSRSLEIERVPNPKPISRQKAARHVAHCRGCADLSYRPFTLDPILALVPVVDTRDGRGQVAALIERLGNRYGSTGESLRQHIYYWLHHGLTVLEADRLAVSLGRHPGNIWPEWWQIEAAS